MKAIKIEKNIPIPVSGKYGERTVLVKMMEKGDSVFTKNHALILSLRAAMRRNNIRSVTRKQGNGWRIWRTSK